jgi:hypothetical protein
MVSDGQGLASTILSDHNLFLNGSLLSVYTIDFLMNKAKEIYRLKKYFALPYICTIIVYILVE